MAARAYRKVTPFTPPEWTKELPSDSVPKSIVTLCQLPTPLHEWTSFPGAPDGFTIGIKRDDLTHSTMSGNKVRKLELLLADALDSGCTAVVTAGCVNTNHGRATAVAAKELGLDTYLVLAASKSELAQKDKLPCSGNVLLDRMVGAGMVLAHTEGAIFDCVNLRMKKVVDDLADRGQKAYIVPVGGTSVLGTWAYLAAFQEMIEQGLLENYDDIVAALGSAGTCVGLAIANYLLGSPLKIHGVVIAEDEQLAHQLVNAELQQIGLADKGVRSEDIIDVVGGYVAPGYGMASDEVFDFILSVSRNTGIILDQTFCGKAAFGMRDLMHKQPERFKGKRILFLHSGGVFGVYNRSIEPRLQETSAGQVVDWTSEEQMSPLPRLLK